MKPRFTLSSAHPVTAACTDLVPRQRWLVAGLHVLTLLLLALHLYVRTLPATPTPIPEPDSAEAAWWGLWPVTYAPAWAVTAATLLIMGWIALWWFNELAIRPTDRRLWAPFTHLTRHPPPTALLFIALLLLLAFYAWPIAHTRWGDAYLLAQAIAWPDPAVRLTHSWQAPLDLFLHSQLWLRWHEVWGWTDAIPVYRLLSPVAGLLYLVAALGLARLDERLPGWLAFGLLTSLGVLQLFFGYIENYSFVAAAMLCYLWVGLRVVTGQSPLWLAASILALTNALHPSTIVLAPSLLYGGWVCWRQQTNAQHKTGVQTFLTTGFAIALPMVLVAMAVVVGMEWGGHGLTTLTSTDRPGGGDARLFVPLWATSTRWEHYTMFSWPHLRDFLNEQLLVAPVVLPGLLITLLAARTEKSKAMTTHAEPGAPSDPPPATHHSLQVTFLLFATCAYLLFVWVWNPDYGGQRDWDLFSLATIPAALLLAITLPRRFADQRYLQAGTIPLLMLQWLHLAAWVYQNTLPWAWPS